LTLASPVVADGFIVTVTLEGVVSALRADTGELVWRVSLGTTVQGTPAVARGRVFVPTIGDTLFALGLADGATLWSRDIGGMTLSSPATVDGDIVLAPGFPQLNAMRLSGDTGAIVWQSGAVMWQFSNTSPAVGGGLAVFGSQQGHYYALDVATGALRWEYVADGTVNLAAPIIVGGRVYMAGGDQSNRVHAVDLATGKAAAGWPIVLPTPAPDVAGTRQGGWRAVSSFAAAGGLLLLQTRLDDALGARTNGPFDWLSREMVVALDPSSGALVWQHALARAQNSDVNNVPKFFVCPTPAAYGTDGGSPLVAVASSLDATVAVLDVATGGERARYAASGASLASPVIANGRLYATALNGTTEAFASSVNHAPAAPVAVQYATPLDAATLTLSWSAATDPDGETSGYELRIDADGEILEDWQQQLFVDAGLTSARIMAPLVIGVPYTFAVRAHDPRGAMSPWSKPATFTVIGTATVVTTMGGTPPPPPPPPGGMPPPPPPPGGMAPTPDSTASPPGGTTSSGAGQMMALVMPADATGCSVGGPGRDGWLAVLVLCALITLRTRRRPDGGKATR
jgi:MYXO-CTERM domain-containing protein